MFNFIGVNTRSTDSFGISGLMAPDAQVFYSSLFSTRHMGRVSDLLTARLKASGVDELRLRTFVLLSVFQAYQAQFFKRKGAPTSVDSVDDAALDHPITLECGIDHEKIILSVNFNLSLNIFLNTEGLVERVGKKEPSDQFESMLMELQLQSDQILMKFQPEVRRTEIDLYLALPGRAKQDDKPKKLELAILEGNKLRNAPAPKIYTHLGDLDYPALLRDPKRARGDKTEEPEELLQERFADELSTDSPADLEEFSNSSDPDLSSTNSSSIEEPQFDLNSTDSNSGPEGLSADLSGSQQDLSGPKIVVTDKAEDTGGGVTWVPGMDDLNQGFREEVSAVKSFFGGLQNSLKKVFKSRRPPPPKKVAQPESVMVRGQAENLDLGSVVISGSNANSDADPDFKTFKMDDPDNSTAEQAIELPELLAELHPEGVSRALQIAQDQINELRSGMNSKANKKIDVLLKTLANERSKVITLAKQMSRSNDKKDQFYKNRIDELQNELRIQESITHEHKDAALSSKDTIAQLNLTIQELRANPPEEPNSKQKYVILQKALITTREENKHLSQQVSDLKTQLGDSKANLQSQAPSHALFKALQSKYERVFKQAEELKRSNRELMDHLDRSRQKAAAPPVASIGTEEMKRRLEAAMKIVSSTKKETDAMRTKISNLQKREIALTLELNRLQGDGSKKDDGGSPSEAA